MDIRPCVGCGESALGKAGQDSESFLCVECGARTEKIKKEPKTPATALKRMFGEKSPEGKKKKKKKTKKIQNDDQASANLATLEEQHEESLPLASVIKSIKAMENDLMCAVCIDLVAKPVTLADCGHTFCFLCLRKTVKKARENNVAARCPTCRAIVKHPPTASSCMIEQVVRAVIDTKPEPRRTECLDRLVVLEREVEREYEACSGWPWNCLKRLEPMWDEEDTVFRCPECAWEIDEEGECTNRICRKSFDPGAVRVDIRGGEVRPSGGQHDDHSVVSSEEEEEEGANEFDYQDGFINDASDLSVDEEDEHLDADGESESGGDSGDGSEDGGKTKRKERKSKKRRKSMAGSKGRMAVSCAREQRAAEEHSESSSGEESNGAEAEESDDSQDGARGRRMLKDRRRLLAEKKRRKEAKEKKKKPKKAESSEDEEEVLARTMVKADKRRRLTALESSDGEQEADGETAPSEGPARKKARLKGGSVGVERQNSKRTQAAKGTRVASEEEEEEEEAGSETATRGFSSPGESDALDSDDEPCVVCGSNKDPAHTILCDGCDAPHHAQCVGLNGIPTGSWYCKNCCCSD